ncbi:MAG TPA: hypothetical protein PKL78_04215 [Anaerolineales bacterium]|nr:hypothetical protein [Anaerolineales bacterium]
MKKLYSFNKKLPQPSIIEGISKMADFQTLKERYRELLDNENVDFHAILSDWIVVGKDLQSSIDLANQELLESTNV